MRLILAGVLLATGFMLMGISLFAPGAAVIALTDFEVTKMVANGITGYLVRDTKTGCEYFATYNGGVTPRLQADGKQRCAP